eukprot:g1082.t1
MGENIGMAARAMLNCGLSEMRLVRPRDGWPSEKARETCSGAYEVIDGVRVYETTADAVADLTRVYATTARPREMVARVLTPRAAAAEMRREAAAGEPRAGVLFGGERSGLANEDVSLADTIITAPLNPGFTSLNLAQAVLLVAYEWFAAGDPTPAERLETNLSEVARKESLDNFIDRLGALLDEGGFFRSAPMRPTVLRNIRNLFQRARPTEQEVATLHGIMNAAVFLGAAVVAVPIFQRLKLGSILGYLAAGAVLGPAGLAVIDNAENVLNFAEFGVVLLLFVIGLELKPSRLWSLKRDIFGLGMLQVMVTGVLLAAIGVHGLGWSWNAALAGGFAVALSSTAFGVQLLRERGDLNTPYGTRAFSILLFQDLAIVPLLALVPLLAVGAEGAAPDWVATLEALGVIVLLVLAGKFLLNPIFRIIAATGSDEISVAAALLVVIGAALLMHMVGMSMALGAFIAGVMLAESEYRHQLEADIDPFRGLLLGLFFIAVGMSVDWRLVLANWGFVLGGAVALMAIKGAILYGLSRAFGSGPKDATRIAVTLPQGGEFGFVLFSVAAGAAILSARDANLMTALVTVSMALTPLVGAASDHIAGRLFTSDERGEMPDAAEAERNSVIVVGFGRVGQVVARIFMALGIPVTAIDGDPKRIEAAKRFGHKVYFGDATRTDVLAAAGAGEADMIFVTIDNQKASLLAIQEIRKRFPQIKIMGRAHDRIHAMEMIDSDADFFVRDTPSSA